jgi:hypothetical protein
MEYKVCTICNSNTNINDFFWKNKSLNKRHTQCKSCYKKSRNNVDYYQRTRQAHLLRAKIRNKKIYTENRIKVWEFLKNNPCIDCGINNPIVLEFDHRDKDDKLMEVCKMTRQSYSWKKISDEISKCDVRCANCHRIKTSAQFGYHSYVK